MSIDRWMAKEDPVHIFNGIHYSDIKKQQNNAIFSNLYATRNYHTKWSTSERQISWYPFYVESKIWYK